MLSKAVALWMLAAAGLTPLDEPGYAKLVTAHSNRVLLVSFWATWCEPCRVELPLLAALERKLPARDFHLAVISIDEPEAADTAGRMFRSGRFRETGFIRTSGDGNLFIDSVDPKWSGALPALFLYDRTGKLVRSFIGEVNLADVERAVRAALH